MALKAAAGVIRSMRRSTSRSHSAAACRTATTSAVVAQSERKSPTSEANRHRRLAQSVTSSGLSKSVGMDVSCWMTVMDCSGGERFGTGTTLLRGL